MTFRYVGLRYKKIIPFLILVTFARNRVAISRSRDRQIGFSSMGDARVGSEGFGRRVRAALLWCKVVA